MRLKKVKGSSLHLGMQLCSCFPGCSVLCCLALSQFAPLEAGDQRAARITGGVCSHLHLSCLNSPVEHLVLPGLTCSGRGDGIAELWDVRAVSAMLGRREVSIPEM